MNKFEWVMDRYPYMRHAFIYRTPDNLFWTAIISELQRSIRDGTTRKIW